MSGEDIREKVIKGLEIHLKPNSRCAGCPYPNNGLCGDQLYRDALVLLKAQAPVKPVLDIDTWNCGNCGHTLEHQELLGDNVLFHEQYIYCPQCGRAVKWE